LPEELRAGTEDLKAQARTLLEESDQRQESSDAAPDSFVEHRRSDETVDP
jgi:hypothetical protein